MFRARSNAPIRLWKYNWGYSGTTWLLCHASVGSTFGARRREANLRPMGAARDGGQMNKTA